MPRAMPRPQPRSGRARLTALVLLASALVSPGCSRRQTVLPDEAVPHRLSQPAHLTVWVRRADGLLVEQSVSVPAGWWVASPRVVE